MAFDAVVYTLNKLESKKTAKSISDLDEHVSELDEHVNRILPGYNYKGSVATTSDFPNDPAKGDMYTVTAEGNEEYVYDGTNWIRPNRQAITNGQIDSLYT